MKVSLISQWYTPEPVPLPHDIADALHHRGHSVNVLTGFPNYPRGSVYPPYRQRWGHTERSDGVRINRQPIYPSHNDSALSRSLNYLSFAASASSRVYTLRDADVAFVYGTPLTAAIPALLAHRMHGVPYVLQVQDLWPDSVTASGMLRDTHFTKFLANQVHRLARYIYRNAAAVIGISERMTKELIARGADPRTSHTVYNWSTQERPEPTTPSRPHAVTRFLYAGNLGEMQDLETVVRAARMAEDHCDIEVLLVGEGVMRDRLKALAASLGTRSVRFAERVPSEAIGKYYAQADFSLVTLLEREVFALTVPSKVQAALAHGVPIITTVRGEVASICDRYRCGLTAAPQDPQSLANAMRKASALSSQAHATLRQNARRTYQSLFSRASAIGRIESILSSASSETGNK